jgi:hypothetical protein
MGLAEHLSEGAILQIKTLPFSGSAINSASFGSAYIILGISTDVACRIRFYDDEYSVNDSNEDTRPFGESPSATNIGLIGDISMSAPGNYTLDPVLYGVPSGSLDFLTYFKITENNTTPVSGSLTVYNLEDTNITANINNTFYKQPLKRVITFDSNKNILNSTDDSAGRTYLMLEATADTTCRLRLYGRSQSITNEQEINRTFDQAITNSSLFLLADMELEAGVPTKFIPKIIGSNMETVSSNLSSILINRTAISAKSEIYYILEPPAIVDMKVFVLED